MYKRIIYQIVKYPLIAWLTLKSLPAARKAAATPDKLLWEAPYQGQPILLIALYQQGKIRPDIARLLLQAKAMGMYIIGVNTASLAALPTAYMDCYIERYNFGRDFASYKAGFEHVFHQKNMSACPRLLMINDSVYYDTSRTEKFFKQLIDTDIEVLGATENFEITHHLGSFCLSLDGKILRHPDFQRYWAAYKCSDVRLLVIYRGELELSRCLKGCVSSPDQFRALYDLACLENSLSDKQNINMFLTLARRSPHLSWPKLDLGSCTDTVIRDEIMSYSKVRSQIHLNNAFLVYLGLPIVKLDGFYRGVFSAEDVLLICSQLPASEADELKALLFRKSYGGDTLFGWQKILFMWGLI